MNPPATMLRKTLAADRARPRRGADHGHRPRREERLQRGRSTAAWSRRRRPSRKRSRGGDPQVRPRPPRPRIPRSTSNPVSANTPQHRARCSDMTSATNVSMPCAAAACAELLDQARAHALALQLGRHRERHLGRPRIAQAGVARDRDHLVAARVAGRTPIRAPRTLQSGSSRPVRHGHRPGPCRGSACTGSGRRAGGRTRPAASASAAPAGAAAAFGRPQDDVADVARGRCLRVLSMSHTLWPGSGRASAPPPNRVRATTQPKEGEIVRGGTAAPGYSTVPSMPLSVRVGLREDPAPVRHADDRRPADHAAAADHGGDLRGRVELLPEVRRRKAAASSCPATSGLGTPPSPLGPWQLMQPSRT